MNEVPWTVAAFQQRRRETWKAIRLWSPAATSKSPTRGRVKIPHLAVTGRLMITRFDAPWQGVRRIL
jgi:hypothetical protein